jgi:hypothetical protein
VEDRAGEITFTSSSIRRSKATGCVVALGVAIFILFQMAKDPTSLVKFYMAVLALVAVGLVVCLVRALRVGIVLSESGVIARTTFSTKSFAWDTIDRAVAKDRRPMSTGRAFVPAFTSQSQQRIQVIPQLRLTSGKEVRLYGLQISIPTPLSPNWVDEAISEINNRLELRRSATGN